MRRIFCSASPHLRRAREQKLGLLDVLMTGTVEDSTCQAVLVTAPSRVGRSRACVASFCAAWVSARMRSACSTATAIR